MLDSQCLAASLIVANWPFEVRSASLAASETDKLESRFNKLSQSWYIFRIIFYYFIFRDLQYVFFFSFSFSSYGICVADLSMYSIGVFEFFGNIRSSVSLMIPGLHCMYFEYFHS